VPMKPVALRTFAVAIGLAMMAACGGGGDGTGDVGTGTLRVALTDASCATEFSQVNITVSRVRVHRSASIGESAAGWSDLEIAPPRRINLLDLMNGALEELGEIRLRALEYAQIRLVLERDSLGPLTNSVVPNGGGEKPLDTPSAVQSGIKLNHTFTVAGSEITDLVLDFDACRSLVSRSDGTYGLKPVVRALPRALNGIVGTVDFALSGVVVSAQKNGVVVRQTVPNSVGDFVLAPIDPAQSPYDVVVTATDHATAVVAGVPVASDTTTQISTTATPILLPPSGTPATRTVSGTVTPAEASPTVRALQTLSGVTVEIAFDNADDLTGVHSLTLPIDAPVLATYANPLPLTFAPATGSSGRYTIEAAATGYVTDSDNVDLSSANATKNFVLSVAP